MGCHENRISIWLTQYRKHVVRKGGSEKQSAYNCLVTREEKQDIFEIQNCEQRQEKTVCAWMNWACCLQKPPQTWWAVTWWAVLCSSPLSRSLQAASWILMNHKQQQKQRAPLGSLRFVLCVPVTKLKQGVRKEQVFTLQSILKHQRAKL